MATTVFEKPVSTEIATLSEQIANKIKKVTKQATADSNGDAEIALSGGESSEMANRILSVLTTGGWTVTYSDVYLNRIYVTVGIRSHPSAGSRNFTILYY